MNEPKSPDEPFAPSPPEIACDAVVSPIRSGGVILALEYVDGYWQTSEMSRVMAESLLARLTAALGKK